MLTVPQKIAIAEISQYLCVVYIEKGGLNGNGMDLLLPRKIECIRKSIQYRYDRTPNDATLEETSNYLLAMCALVYLPASIIAATSTGGGSTSIGGNTQVPYNFIVDASTSFMVNGESSKTISSFIGYNLLFARGGIVQSTINTESSYYSWDKATGLFTCSPALVTSELILLAAI